MPWRSLTSQKVGAVLLLAYLSASLLVAAELGRRRHEATSQLAVQQARARELATTIETLDRELAQAGAAASDATPAVAPRAPAEQAAAVVQLMRAADSNFGVRWRTLSLGGGTTEITGSASGASPSGNVGGAGSSGHNLAVSAMFTPLPEVPQLQAARLRAEGEYRNLAGLLDMIDSLKRQGTAITELALEGEQVTMSGYVVAGIR